MRLSSLPTALLAFAGAAQSLAVEKRDLLSDLQNQALENLKAAAAGENEEWTVDYPHFADVAEKEGFNDIALMYRNIAVAEKGHEERYRAFVENIEKNRVFEKDGKVMWQCRNCGFIYEGTKAPEVCPACLHPKAYFEVMKTNM